MYMEGSQLIMESQPHLPAADFSHRGLVRDNNEDRLTVQGFGMVGDSADEVTLAVLCDGVGGHAAGEVAARAGVDAVVEAISHAETFKHPDDLLNKALQAANLAVLEQSKTNASQQGMGATCTCALIIGSKLYIANMGDSRIYLVRGNGIYQLTYDHTWLDEATLAGWQGVEAVTRQHPLAHMLSRYLGSAQPVAVDLRIRYPEGAAEDVGHALQLQGGDRVMLCSDGLTDLVSDKDILLTLRHCRLEKAAKTLVLQALQNGGYDNVSVVVLEKPV
jgi:serine/threonine protein phosphatase PrpC